MATNSAVSVAPAGTTPEVPSQQQQQAAAPANGERGPSNRPTFASTSLYVGDLHPEVSETTLYEFFNSVGPVASIRVCRDTNSRKSLRYAYVNYHSIADAERALDNLNYTTIRDVPCRIMWSQRDPSTRKSSNGNLFVRNLDRTVDNRALHDAFSLFGNILSCKVVYDDEGRSRGYGFVHFENPDAAATAAQRVHGMRIGSKEVFVGPFVRRSERPNGRAENFTNVYVKNYPAVWDESKIREIFSTCGEITSIFTSSDARGRPFACVNFASPVFAKKAVSTLNSKCVNSAGLVSEEVATRYLEEQESRKREAEDKATDGETPQVDKESDVFVLYVDRAQEKSERSAALRSRHEKSAASRPKFDGVNLYVKNLPDSVDDEGLRALFESFGSITSARIMYDESGHSKGFGFVCYTSPEDATKALAEMHLKVFDSKPLYVGIAEPKDRRQARLQTHFNHSARKPAPAPTASFPPMPYYPPAAWAQPGFRPPPQPGFPMWKPTAVAAPIPPPVAAPPAPVAPVAVEEPTIADSAAAAATTDSGRRSGDPVAKQVLGEQLFPLIYRVQPEYAGKITGMMLDMEEEELRTLLISEPELNEKINEALAVLAEASN